MATLFDDSALFGEPWLVASELRFDAKDALLLRGAPVDEAALRRDFPQHFVEEDTVRWDATRRPRLDCRSARSRTDSPMRCAVCWETSATTAMHTRLRMATADEA